MDTALSSAALASSAATSSTTCSSTTTTSHCSPAEPAETRSRTTIGSITSRVTGRMRPPRGRGDDGRSPTQSSTAWPTIRKTPAPRRPFSRTATRTSTSSGVAYGRGDPLREGETPLHECTLEQATDDSFETYGNRKAEGDRAVFAAAEDGVRAMAVRPPIVYGPHDHTERLDWWIDRVNARPRRGARRRDEPPPPRLRRRRRERVDRGRDAARPARPTTSATDGSSRSRR